MKKLKHIILFVFILLLWNNEGISQEDQMKTAGCYITAGFGILDLINAGLGYNNDRFQAGLRMGSFPVEE